MPTPRSHPRALATLIVAGALLAACGGSDNKTVATTTSETAAATSTSSVSSTSTSAASTSTSGTAAGTSTTATVPAAPTYALTGMPIDDPAKANRPALVIKVNNVASARPQFGINQADIVFEEKIGTSVTRLFSVFQSTDADKVGSIRSARASDLPILAALSKPLLVWSGSNENLTPVLLKADITDAGYSHHSDLYQRGRLLPDYTEFFVSTADIRTLTPEGQGAPKPILQFRGPGEPAPTGQAVKAATWSKNGYEVGWEWDAAKGGWLRTQAGTPHLDAAGVQVAPANVVMMYVNYTRAFDDPRSPEAVSVGKGEAWVLTNGVVVATTWSRATGTDPFVFSDAAGNPVKLTPGRTWVELAEDGSGELIPA